MKRFLLLGVAAVAMLAFPGIASAANVHLKGGKNAEPSFTDNGLSLTATGAIVGLGEGDVLVDMTAQANATSVCTNPSGGTQPPGQNPAPVTVGGQQLVTPQMRDKNGNTPFAVTTNAPSPTIAGAPGCPGNPDTPGGNWTQTITNLSFTSAVIKVYQPPTISPANLVLTVSCTFTPPTSDGPVPSGQVTCTES